MKLTMLTTCDENVDRLCSIDCSSPMSAKMPSRSGTVLSAEAGGKPVPFTASGGAVALAVIRIAVYTLRTLISIRVLF